MLIGSPRHTYQLFRRDLFNFNFRGEGLGSLPCFIFVFACVWLSRKRMAIWKMWNFGVSSQLTCIKSDMEEFVYSKHVLCMSICGAVGWLEQKLTPTQTMYCGLYLFDSYYPKVLFLLILSPGNEVGQNQWGWAGDVYPHRGNYSFSYEDDVVILRFETGWLTSLSASQRMRTVRQCCLAFYAWQIPATASVTSIQQWRY